ncbi:intermembrane lipid transfer protein VPS13B-like [Engraulis encrasicolus]|uniref:intermembrane lipid transfer protein VPS13B-like n=1 Tax=Engraulis encrasicolus TaxID=184585 RepID=UPI002FD76DC9
MLESYVTPLLMSYVNRYIKNLKPSDLQLSLWGGDVVLSKLDLKLDVLEQELKLPFTFLSGHIHELRIHVPWTKLGSEPVVITINTMECILKLKDGAQDEHDSCGSSSTSRSASDSAKSVAKPRRLQQAAPTDPDLPPGYVQSLIRRVANNVNIVVNNLILKYVEDDIVLSVNITSAECYTVDELWDRNFMDITAPDLVLRKVINFSDCTVCLDKRNASGKIEFYQDPLLYKCSFRTRLHFTYDNINSKIPAVIKIQTMVESLKLSMTDQQLPMFIRVLELALALYYGEMDSPKEAEGDKGPAGSGRDVVVSSIPGMEVDLDPQAMMGQYPSPDQYMSPGSDDDDQGWVSWAWSFVPAIVSVEDEEGGFYAEDEEGGGSPSGGPTQHTPKEPVVSIGLYCTKASVMFKLTETQSESSYYSPQKVKSREVLCVEQEGITVEALMKGEPFFDCQIGVVGCRAYCLKGIMGVRDFEENMNRREEDAVFFTCGDSLSSKGMTYLTNSLFDYRSPENNGVRAEFVLDGNLHKESSTEIAGLQRFGAFYLDYLYTMENATDKGCVGSQDFSSTGKEEPPPPVQESSVKRLVIGPIDLRLHSSAVHRIFKMVACALDHEYEPYIRPKPDVVEERAPPTQEELSALEEFIPTRLTSVTLLSISVTLCMAEFNLLHTVLPLIMGHKTCPPQPSSPVSQVLRPLPVVRLLVERVNLEHSEPMYAPELVSAVSSLSQPSDNLLHHCYAHCYLKVFGFQVGLSSMDAEGSFLPLIPIVPSFSTALYAKLLRLPAYWTKRSSVSTTECIFELPHFSVQGSRAQLLLLQAIGQSWTHSLGNGATPALSEGLLNDVYKTPTAGAKASGSAPVLEASVQSVELKWCRRATVQCASGTVGALKVCARTLGSSEGQKELLVPLIQGPSDTKELHQSRWLNELRKPESLLAPDLLAFSIQVPQQGDDCRNSGAVLLVSVQGIAVNVDPVFCTWLLYQPPKGSGSRQQQQAQGVPQAVMSGAKRRDDEASVGSAPQAKQPSNQASDYASSPVKTKTVTESRPLSIPMKVLPSSGSESCSSPEERMKELIACVWDAVKRLTLQLELQSCCVFVPNDSLPSPSTLVCGDIPGTVRSWYHGQAAMPGTLVLCLPQVGVLSAGHRRMEPLQEIPFAVSRPILEEGDAFPWTVSLSQFSVYTLLGQQRSLSLLEPMGCTSTLAITSHKLQVSASIAAAVHPQAAAASPAMPTAPAPPEGLHRHAFIVCLHVDLEPVRFKCSNPQIQLLYDLFLSWSSTWSRLQRRGILRQTSSFPPDAPSSAAAAAATGGAGPSSPVPSSAGTMPPDTSTCSPSADFCSPTEGDSVQAADDSPFAEAVTLEQRTSSIGGASGKVSLWMQWMLPKVTAKLFAPDPLNNKSEICVLSELEDLSASVDVQDVYTKIKCKVGSFNIDHYRTSLEEGPGGGLRGGGGGVVLSCTDKLNRRTVLVRPVSKQDPFNHHFSGFFPPTAAKALEVSHQQHGFLSVTYTQAVTRNVRHKLTARQERAVPRGVGGGVMGGGPGGGGVGLGGLGAGFLGEGQYAGMSSSAAAAAGTMALVDGSPQHLHEILLTAQPFDLVLSCPLLAAVAGVLDVTPGPSSRRRQLRERGRQGGGGQPMRSHAFTSSSLPLIYVNTSVIRLFCPTDTDSPQKKEDTLVLKIGSVSMAPQADNPLTRTVLRKDIYQRALNLGILRDPGSEVEDRQYQLDLQSINIGTARWEQLRPEKDAGKAGSPAEVERNSQNPALEWNMASSIKRHQERRAILTPILTDFSVRVTAAPAIIFSRPISPDNSQVEEMVVCGHSLEVNVTTGLDFFLSVAQVQLLQQLLTANMLGAQPPEKSTEVRGQEQQRAPSMASSCAAESVSSWPSGAPGGGVGGGGGGGRGAGIGVGAQDSGFGSDSARLRIVQIEQQSGASHHRLARPSRQPTITKNLSFIPFDVFLTAGRVAVMTYATSRVPKPSQPTTPTTTAADATSPKTSTTTTISTGDRPSKSALNMPEGDHHPPAHVPDPASSPPPPATPATAMTSDLSVLTAEDLLNSNSPMAGGRTPGPGGLLSLESLQAPSRSSARQALGVTVVRQPGRRGAGDSLLEPLLYLQLFQPSALLSCHHRKQRLELSLFDTALKGVAPTYKCIDPGKSLPEALDYSVFWLQTVAGEVDSRTGIPPPLLTLQIKDFLNGPAELNVELSRPLKVNPTLAKLDQAKAFLRRVFPETAEPGHPHTTTTTTSTGPQSSPSKTASHRAPSSAATPPSTPSRSWGASVGGSSPLLSLQPFHKVSVRTVQMVVALDTDAHPARPSLSLSVSGLKGSLVMKQGPKLTDPVQLASLLVEVDDLLVKTGLRDRSRLLLGPLTCSAELEARWCRHSRSPAPGPEPGPPKLLLDLKGGLLQVFWGQEHLNCLLLIQEYLQGYLQKKNSGQTQPGPEEPPPASRPHSPPGPHPFKTEHSSDDLRTGLFQYIQDPASQKLPGPHEVVFYNETDDSPGVMMWRYPEPRVLTFVRITPVPFNTTEDPDISTADLGDVLQVPCSLEYWDEIQRAFVPYRDFSLSESQACELQLPSVGSLALGLGGLDRQQRELVASDLWRVVVNSTADTGDEQSSDSESGSQLQCEQLVSPTALAACTRVDSCFAPWFVPSVGIALQLAQIQLRFCHHLEQLGTAPNQRLRPFLSDRKLPPEQEYMLVCVQEPQAYLRQWSGRRPSQLYGELSLSSQLDCQLLEYRNLTLRPLVRPFGLRGQLALTQGPPQEGRQLDGSVFVEPVFVTVSQHMVHTLDTAVKGWQQNLDPEAEELLFSHYVICNDTQESLRFGQVDTDENVLLSSLNSHQYSWRSHKSSQLLHICMEGWGNWRWSEAFSIDNVGTLLRTIQYKGQTASLIIKVQQLSGVQKQVVICGRQVMCSYLSVALELRVVQHYVGTDGQPVVREHVGTLEAGGKLPSYVLEDGELTELCVRAHGDEDWSQDVRLDRKESSVVQVPCSSGSLLNVWCTVVTLEADTHMQQRVVVFSPLFMLRSHLPDPVIIHVEKRSLGLRESQLVQGQGHQEALVNTEADLTHHLTFQAREDEDASQCAVPISSSLIKQIVSKASAEESSQPQALSSLLSHFYGREKTSQAPWPYTARDADRSSVETVAQWDSPMQVRLCAWRPGLSTLLVELLPWALLANHSQWDLWLFEGERIVLQIPAGKTIVPPNFKEAFQIGIYWANTNTVHKSPALKLMHEETSPRWKEAASPEVIALDEDAQVEADITLGASPGRQKVCQFCVSSMVRHGMQILKIEDRTILVNNTSLALSYTALLSEHSLADQNQPCRPVEAAVFTLAPARESGRPRRCAVPCWDLLKEPGPQAQGQGPPPLESPLPVKHLLLATTSATGPSGGPDGAAASWSLPMAVRPDLPRQSVALPAQPESSPDGLHSRPLVLTYQEHMGVTYVTVSEDPSPRMLLHNRCPIDLLLKENTREPPRTEVFCRPLPALSSLHHELYHQASAFPDCRPRESLPTLLLRATPGPEAPALTPQPAWTEPIDINSPGTQVVFLPSFGCLYVDVAHQSGTVVLTLAPESCAGTIISQHNRLSSQTVSCRVLLSEASVALCDDITSPSGSVELLRLTLTKLLLHLSPAHLSALSPDLHSPPTTTTTTATITNPSMTPTSSTPMTSSSSAWDLHPDPGSTAVGVLLGGSVLELYCSTLQLDNQLYTRASFHFPVLLCQDSRTADPSPSSPSSSSSSSSSSSQSASSAPWSAEAHPLLSPRALQAYRGSCFLRLTLTLAPDLALETAAFQLQPARVYLEDTFVYYVKTLFHSYLPDSAFGSSGGVGSPSSSSSSSSWRGCGGLPEEVLQATQALVRPVRLRRLTIQPVSLLVSIHASLKLYIASDHTPLAFSLFERAPLCTTARQLVHALAMHYAAGALFRAGWVVGSLEILGSPASLVRSIGNGVSDFFRLPYEGLTRGPGAFVSGVSRGTTSFVKHISKGTLTSITNLATSLARNMDRLSLDEEHYTRQEEWRRQLPESLGDGLRQGLSRLGISLLGAIAGIVDQPMQNFQRTWELQSSAGSTAKGVISGVGKGIVGVFTKPIGGAAELVSQTGYGILHGAGLWELPKQLYLPAEEQAAQAPNSHLKYVWKLLQSLGRPEVHMALRVGLVSGGGMEHAGCLLLTADVLFVVSLSEDTQQQAFPITEVTCTQEPAQPGELILTLQQQKMNSDNEADGGRERLSEQQYRRLVEYVTRVSQHLSPSPSTSSTSTVATLQQAPSVTVTPAEPPPSLTKTYRYLVEPAHARVFVYKFNTVKNKALRLGFH